MKILFILLFFVGCVPASQYTIQSRFFDLTPNDGFMDEGSYANPYAVKDEYGQEIITIRPQYIDLVPGDGFMDAGSYSNPYIVE